MVNPVDRAAQPPRVVLLGASNLARGMASLVETTRQLSASPVEIFAALGHGRSYGLTTVVLGRELPGILQCGLWSALAEKSPAPTYALLTDIGNDLMYGMSVSTIIDWITECLDRLAAHDAQITLTELPLVSVRMLTPRRFELLRRILFPSRPLDLKTLLTTAETLNDALVSVATERQIRVISPQKQWFGLDPIHIRARHYPTAWDHMLSAWRAADLSPTQVGFSLARWLYLRSRIPAERKLFGRLQRCAQPCVRFRDGSTLALY